MRNFAVSALAGVVVMAALSQALAQQAPSTRVRGTIERIDDSDVTIKTGTGSVKVTLAGNVQVYALARGSLADIKPGQFIGAGATPEPDGSQKAIQVVIFAEALRGTGEGHYPWNRPGTTMTNATVTETVASTDGPVITVKYPDGEKKIVVVPETVIRLIVATDRNELKAGSVVATSATKRPDGSFEAARINVGRDGIEPQ